MEIKKLLFVWQKLNSFFHKTVTFIKADICDEAALDAVFKAHDIEAVVHFAGLKAVGESNDIPLSYYQNNVSGSVTLFQVMAKNGTPLKAGEILLSGALGPMVPIEKGDIFEAHIENLGNVTLKISE